MLTIFEQIVFSTSHVKPALRIKNILPPRFVKADANITVDSGKDIQAGMTKTPRTEKTGPASRGNAMIMQGGG
jgi:hypothetical protein